MKNIYRVILIGLVVLGVVYASTGPEKKNKEEEKETEEAWKYKPIDICKFPVYMDVGHYVQLKECHKRKIELKQVDCEEISISEANRKFPCYKGSDVISVRANFPAILNASLDKSGGKEDMLKEVNLYWENDVNIIRGCTGDWEELKLCLEVCDAKLYKFAPGTVEVGEITIQVKPIGDIKDESNDNPKDDKKLED
jgi:hypothetical protein